MLLIFREDRTRLYTRLGVLISNESSLLLLRSEISLRQHFQKFVLIDV